MEPSEPSLVVDDGVEEMFEVSAHVRNTSLVQ
jgi:hypothetical protein